VKKRPDRLELALAAFWYMACCILVYHNTLNLQDHLRQGMHSARVDDALLVGLAFGSKRRHAKRFDMRHVLLTKGSPEFIRNSLLSDTTVWCEVDLGALQYSRYAGIFLRHQQRQNRRHRTQERW